jgi:hypothetical protein
LITEPGLVLIPDLGVYMSVTKALFLQQLYYWTRRTVLKDETGDPVVAYTYNDWKAQFPFVTIRWLKQLVADLEHDDWISVDRGPSYNRYKMSATYKKRDEELRPLAETCITRKFVLDTIDVVKVFPSLVMSVGA